MTFKKTREAQDKKRAFILNIINKSERGKYKNICSGEAHCKNKTIYKYHLYILIKNYCEDYKQGNDDFLKFCS